MMNSRTRRRPPRGRASSRSLMLKWYQTCGSSLYDRSSRAWNVIVSSCVSGSTNGRPLRSVSLKTSGIAIRPVRSQSSAGVSTGQSISWPPIASISSRMIWTTFWWTRQPAGSQVKRPAPTWRMKPPRRSSLCETASASAGSSRRVGRKSFDWRCTMRRTLDERRSASVVQPHEPADLRRVAAPARLQDERVDGGDRVLRVRRQASPPDPSTSGSTPSTST